MLVLKNLVLGVLLKGYWKYLMGAGLVVTMSAVYFQYQRTIESNKKLHRELVEVKESNNLLHESMNNLQDKYKQLNENQKKYTIKINELRSYIDTKKTNLIVNRQERENAIKENVTDASVYINSGINKQLLLISNSSRELSEEEYRSFEYTYSPDGPSYIPYKNKPAD